MDQLYAKIGRQHLEAERLNAEYDALLKLLGDVIAGTTERSRVLVNLTNRCWALSPPGQQPAMPATINGLPVCIVSPAEEAMMLNAEAVVVKCPKCNDEAIVPRVYADDLLAKQNVNGSPATV